MVGLIGLNGAGKSTLMRTVYGFLTCRQGRIVYDDLEITGFPPHTMVDRGLWYVPQESSLFPYLSVADNLGIVVDRLRSTAARARREEVLAGFPALRAKLARSGWQLIGRPAEDAGVCQGPHRAAASLLDR